MITLLALACTRPPDPESVGANPAALVAPSPPAAHAEAGPPLVCSARERDPRLNFEHVIDGRATPCDLAAYQAFLDSRQAVSGPWVQDVRIARSADGLTFVELPDTQAVRSAGVPEAVRGADRRIYLFYVDGDLERAAHLATSGSSWFGAHGLVGHGALRLAVSDDGVRFQDVEEFGIVGAVRGMLVDPEVLPLPDGRWRLYYVGVPVPDLVDSATWEPGAQHDVYSAVSDDLIHWQQEGKVVRGPFADPTVHCRPDGTCLMLSFGLDWAESEDGGRTFHYKGPWTARGFAPDLVPLPDGRLRVYWNDSEKGAIIRSRISADGGRTWTDEDGSRLADLYGEAPTVLQAGDGSWLMYSHRFKPGEERRFGQGGKQGPGTQPAPARKGPPPGAEIPPPPVSAPASAPPPPAPAAPPGG